MIRSDVDSNKNAAKQKVYKKQYNGFPRAWYTLGTNYILHHNNNNNNNSNDNNDNNSKDNITQNIFSWYLGHC